jgi:hypothetical protein
MLSMIDGHVVMAGLATMIVLYKALRDVQAIPKRSPRPTDLPGDSLDSSVWYGDRHDFTLPRRGDK